MRFLHEWAEIYFRVSKIVHRNANGYDYNIKYGFTLYKGWHPVKVKLYGLQ